MVSFAALKENKTLRKIDAALRVKPDPDADPALAWTNKDLDPVPPEKRTWGPLDIFGYWISDQYATATWDLGSTIVSLGLTAREGIPLTFFAFFFIGIILTLNGRIGSNTHLSFPVIVRASFGMWGGYIAILARSTLAICWLCILTYQAGSITAVMLTAIWPSYDRIKNTLPEGLGITSQTLLGFAIFWIIQTPLCCTPVHKLKYFFWFKMVVCPITFFGMFVWGLVVTKGHAPYIDGPLQIKGSKFWAVIQALNACTGLYSTLSINIADFARFSRSNAVNWYQLIAIPLTGTTPVICSIIAVAAAKQLWGIDAWDPAELISHFDSRAVQFFAAFGFLVATVGSNISANCISFATDFTAILPRYFTIFRAALLASVLCFAVNPWKIVTSAPTFYNFLASYPVFLAPVATIICVDWYVVRKGKVHIRDLYIPHGRYHYTYGFNWRAIAAWIIAFGPNLPAFAHAVNPSNPDVQPYTYYFSWYFSTFVSGVAYYIINRLAPPRETFVTEAIYEIEVPQVENPDDRSEKGSMSSARVAEVV